MHKMTLDRITNGLLSSVIALTAGCEYVPLMDIEVPFHNHQQSEVLPNDNEPMPLGKIVFAGNDMSEENPARVYDTFIINTDGSNLQPLTNNNEGRKDLSRFGDYIAFIRDNPEGSTENIYIINVNTSEETQLTDHLDTINGCDNLRWSPSGSMLVADCEDTALEPYPSQIYLITIAERTERVLPIGGSNTDPFWSPDGRSIAAINYDVGGIAHVVKYNLDDDLVTSLTNNAFQERSPTWLLGGRIIFFRDDINYDNNFLRSDVFSIDENGEAEQQLTSHVSDNIWCDDMESDGNRFLVYGCTDGNVEQWWTRLHVFDLISDEERILIPEMDVRSPEVWMP